MTVVLTIVGVLAVLLLAVVAYDLLQTKHAVLRNFPIIGHLRYILEKFGPELRQYIVTSNDAERPFSRDQRSWIYASAKRQNNLSAFGTDNDLEATSGYILVKHAAWVVAEPDRTEVTPNPQEATTEAPASGPAGVGPDFILPPACVIGRRHGRRHAFRPRSLVNVSAMSFGALGRNAIEAINRGVAMAGCLHNTGEGGLCEWHRRGGDLVFQMGTGYFGCRDDAGRFSMERLERTIADAPVRMIEIKLSQGAKPGHGGILPAVKVTPEVARLRGVPVGRESVTPARHSAFNDVPSLIAFIESIAERTGLPVGIKSAVGQMDFWEELAAAMAADPTAGPDFITIDGGEGGTGAAPYTFADHVSLPFRTGFVRVREVFDRHGIGKAVPFIGSARLGFPAHALVAMALGCDMINVAREAMMAIGCIQAQRCHTGHCPTGVATTNPRLNRGLVPDDKAPRLRNYVVTLRHELLELARTVGVAHPALVPADAIELVDQLAGSRPLTELYDIGPWSGLPSDRDVAEIAALMGANPGSGASTSV